VAVVIPDGVELYPFSSVYVTIDARINSFVHVDALDELDKFRENLETIPTIEYYLRELEILRNILLVMRIHFESHAMKSLLKL